jgi:hypothetical protein
MYMRNLRLFLFLCVLTVPLHAKNTHLMHTCNVRAKDPKKITNDGNRDIYGWMLDDIEDVDHKKTSQKMKSQVVTIFSNVHNGAHSVHTK